jgi:hypothetical protein
MSRRLKVGDHVREVDGEAVGLIASTSQLSQASHVSTRPISSTRTR